MRSCMAWLAPTSISMVPSRSFVVWLLLHLSFFSLAPSRHRALADDAQALLAFKENVSRGANLESWNASNPASVCSSWKGVTCSSGRVVKLRLPGSSLVGSIPAQTIGMLDALEVISLRLNRLSGTLPSDLANCTALKEVNLRNNSFSGPLLFNFTAWPVLQSLDLSANNFSGQIPSSLSSLTRLESLLLEDNAFSGAIPSISAPSRTFNVSNNRLNGSIPHSLSNFKTDSFEGNPDLCGSPLPACPSSGSPPPPPPPPPPVSQGDSNLGAGAIVGIVLGSVAAAIILLSVCFLVFARKNAKQRPADDLYAERTTDSQPVNIKTGVNEGTVAININNKLTFIGNAKQTFDLDDLLRASAEVLGKGTLGTSYKASIDDGRPICVKRFREVVTDREHTCKHIEMLGGLQHPNLVSLRAYFFAPKGKLIVSDYMPKGSLSSLLHGNRREAREPLDWEMRLAIAEGAAKGLVFLHSKKVVHGNIKSSNLVMDADGEAYLTDYSLMHLLPLWTEASVTLKPNAHTPPESRADLRRVTYKGDVYAFGVLLLELVTGKSPNSGSLTQGGANIDSLVEWVKGHFPHDAESVLDRRLSSPDSHEIQDEMVSLLQIAMPCVSTAPEGRPHMVEVVSSIGNLRKHTESTDFYFTQAM